MEGGGRGVPQEGRRFDAVLFDRRRLRRVGVAKLRRHRLNSLMNEFKYVRGTVTKLRKRDIAKAIIKAPGAFLSKRIWNSLKEPFITEINSGGLIMLNDLLLRFGAPGLYWRSPR